MPVPRYRSRNVVLRDEVQPATVRAFAERNGWTFHAQIESDPEKGVFYEVRWDVPGGGTAHYIIDEALDCIYLVVRHDDRAVAERLGGDIASRLPSWTVEELLHE